MKKIALSIFTLLYFQNAFAEPEKLSVVEKDSRVGFEIIKFKIGAPVQGVFKKFSGSTIVDMDKNTISDISGIIQVASVDTNDKKRDDHLRSEDFFDVAKYPEITFVSKGTYELKDKFKVKGELTIKGITKEVTLDAKTLQKTNDEVVLELTGDINRLDYKVSWNKALEESEWTSVLGVLGKAVLDNNVKLQLKITAKK